VIDFFVGDIFFLAGDTVFLWTLFLGTWGLIGDFLYVTNIFGLDGDIVFLGTAGDFFLNSSRNCFL
jgi:hypothetical protein